VSLENPYNWDSKRILIVEDDESSSFLLGEILKNTRAELSFSEFGGEAVEFIKANPDVDMVLMDLNLPDMNGLTATQIIKGLYENIVVIAQSAYNSTTDQEKALSAGCDDFLSKPLNPYLLLSKMQHYLG